MYTYKTTECSKCGLNVHEQTADSCEICKTSLLDQQSTTKQGLNRLLTQKFKFTNSLSQTVYPPTLWRLNKAKPLFLSLLGFALLFLLFNSRKLEKSADSSKKISPPVPTTVSSYGGDAIFAPLVANGINQGLKTFIPNLDLRYGKPLNQDYSSVKAIAMLIDGELSFAYNARPLMDQEFQKAKLRSISLFQTPIAIDGIAVFSNLWTPTTKLTLEQVQKIFNGKITNWQQINRKFPNLPIRPVLINHENYKALDFDNNLSTAIKVPTYTAGLKKVINTPGAISFGSLSLVKNQQLVKIFSVSDGNSPYINPLLGSKINTIAIRNGKYPLTRRLFIITKGDNTVDQLVGTQVKQYITSPDGQKIIKKSNFVPLY